MPVQIKKATEFKEVENIIITVYAAAGLGKTTLACTAEKPLILDFDNGSHRAEKTMDTVSILKWSDVATINENDLIDYKTIVIDVVGDCLECLKQNLIKIDSQNRMRNTDNLSLQGYGCLASTFKQFLFKLKSYKKDIILLAHVTPEKDKEVILYNVDIEGKTKRLITKISELVGYIVMDDDGNRILDFNPTKQREGKNCAKFPPIIVPEIKKATDTLAKIVQATKDHFNKRQIEQIEVEKKFDEALTLIELAQSPEQFQELLTMDIIKSHPALQHKFKEKASHCNIIYDKTIKKFERKAS